MKNLEKALWLLAIAGFIAGGYGLYDRIANGHVNVSYGSYVPWGLWVAAYIYLVGVSAGAFLISTLVYAFGIQKLAKIGKLALFTAIITLGISLFSIWLDLGHPERVLRLAFATNFGSMMGWMIWLYAAYFVLLLVELWFALRVDFVAWSNRSGVAGSLARILSFGKRDVSEQAVARDHRVLKVLGSIGIPLAIAFHGGVGSLFGVIGARPYWNSGLTPVMFIIGALLSGGALLTFVTLVFGPDPGSAENKETVVLLGKITLGLLALDVILEFAEYLTGLYASIPAEAASLRTVLFGPYAWVFWGVHVLLGIVVPAAVLLWRGKSATWAGLAGLLIAFTFFSVRLNVVIPGETVPEFMGLVNAFTGPGLTYDYFPTLTEWLVQIWIVSTGVLAFLIGYHILPVVPGNVQASGERVVKPVQAKTAGAVGE
ncbi:MAG TPA: NrfD/PsrC family molybdoenzyme membrane anchor subunit [Anaerolineae bacterium]